ncbi:MAG: hypothetical protein ACKPKO_03495, partial [Candidatus Fonsibacter sp.]
HGPKGTGNRAITTSTAASAAPLATSATPPASTTAAADATVSRIISLRTYLTSTTEHVQVIMVIIVT